MSVGQQKLLTGALSYNLRILAFQDRFDGVEFLARQSEILQGADGIFDLGDFARANQC